MSNTTDNNQKVNPSDERFITIELDHLLIPIAILLAGIMVSGSIWLSMRNWSEKSDTNTVAPSVQGNNGVADTPEVPQSTNASTSIDDDYYLGDKSKAKIAIVEFSDYQCPFCQRHFQQTNSKLVENFVNTGKAILVFRDLPLDFHQLAQPAAVAANCAGDQGGSTKYFAMHDEIFGKGLTSETELDTYAQNIGLDIDKFNNCKDSDRFDAEVKSDIDAALAAGLRSTPSFVIGVLKDDGTVEGKKIIGAVPYAEFEKVINEYI